MKVTRLKGKDRKTDRMVRGLAKGYMDNSGYTIEQAYQRAWVLMYLGGSISLKTLCKRFRNIPRELFEELAGWE